MRRRSRSAPYVVMLVLAEALAIGALVLVLACAPAVPAPVARQPGRSAAVVAVEERYLRDLDTLIAAVARLDTTVATATGDSAVVVRARFVAARRAWKRVELLVEHFTPGTADGINGPALDDMAEDDPNHTVIPPEGFQVVEEWLWPEVRLDDRTALRGEIGVLLANVRRARYNAAATPLTDATVLDAVRLELVRIVTLGLAGFDSPVALRGVAEAADAVAALRDVMAAYDADVRGADPALADTVRVRLARAEAALRAGASAGFDRFDRLTFILEHAEPVAAALLAAQQALRVPMPTMRRAWRPTTASPFAAGAIDPVFFAPAPQREATAAQVALGEALFFDPVLSRNGARSCATCHQPGRAFADGLAARTGGTAHGAARNTPTVLNSALQGGTFADLRTTFLEDQVADVVRNADEMHGSLEEATAAVARRAGHAAAFRDAFPAGAAREDESVTPARVRQALAAYLRSLVALDARFDRYVRGDPTALTTPERDGFNVFMGKAKCGTCHFAPLFNGVVPPTWAKTESEVLGVPSRPVVAGATVDADRGRARVTRLPIHEFAFRTPSLRNVAVTAPYMHNGVYRTLEEVVEFYDRGGGAGIGIDLPNQTLPPDPLRLTRREKASLVAFMRALTDTTSAGRPVLASVAR